MSVKAEYYIRTYVCDNGIEYKTKFPVRAAESCPAHKRRTAVRRAEKLATESKTEFGRVLNCNFRAGRDVYMGLDYSDKGLAKLVGMAGGEDMDSVLEAARRNISERFMKRLRRACAKEGIELRAAFITSDMDGRTGEAVRVHHHMVINAEAAALAAKKWNDGGSWERVLYSHHHGDLQELADYLIGQVRCFAGMKRYTCTRNLKKPVASKPIKARKADAELQVPRGCEKIHRSEYRVGRPQHIRYYRPPKLRDEGGEAA